MNDHSEPKHFLTSSRARNSESVQSSIFKTEGKLPNQTYGSVPARRSTLVNFSRPNMRRIPGNFGGLPHATGIRGQIKNISRPIYPKSTRNLSMSRSTVVTTSTKMETSRTTHSDRIYNRSSEGIIDSLNFQISNDELKLQSFQKRNFLINDDIFVVPAAKSSESIEIFDTNETKYKGIIDRILLTQKVAYIIPDNQQPQHKRKDVKFKLSDLVNHSDSDIVLEKGSAVVYTLCDKESSCRIQIADKVFVNEASQVKEDDESDFDSQPVYAKKWHIGVVVVKKQEPKAYYFVKPISKMPAGYKQNNNIYLPACNAPNYGFPLKVGDKIEFLLGTNEPGRTKALKTRYLSFSNRTIKSVLEHFDCMLNNLNSKEKISGLLSCTAFWSFVASITFKNETADVYYFLRLMRFVILVFQASHSYASFCVSIIKIIFSSAQLNINSPLFTFLNYDNLQRRLYIDNLEAHEYPNIGMILMDFFDVGLKLDASLSSRAFPFILKIGESETSNRVQMWLIDIIRNVSESISSQSFSQENWRELTLIPQSREIRGAPLEDDTLLLPVKVDEKYNSAEEYMDTYYRLLRTECFSKVQNGIDDLCANELDHRDMNVYHSIYLGGYDITNSGFALALQFTPVRRVKHWERAGNFMFGNLLCISPSGKFQDDHIWATVSNRDTTLLSKHSTIVVQLCTESNYMTDCQAMRLLWENGGVSVMVESPAYFHSFKPVLQSLQKFDMEKFPLYREIVECCNSEPPDYMSDSSMFNPACILPNETKRITKAELFEKLTFQSSTLDQSQIRAIKHSLSNRLAIIQGPPGCGKTFIGVKLAELILSCRPSIQGPILVLTYKNHALDEFLKHTLKFLDKSEIIRIGGRSKEPELERCNLKYILDNERYDRETYYQLCNIKGDIQCKIDEIHREAKRLHFETQTSPVSFLKLLSERQLVNMLKNAPFRKIKFKTEGKLFANKNWVSATISSVLSQFKSLKFFIQMKEPKHETNPNHFYLHKFIKRAIHFWWPSAEKLQALKELQTAYLAEIQKTKMMQNDELEEKEIDDADEYCDEELIDSIQENRLSALEGYLDSNNKIRKSSDNLTLWPKCDDRYRMLQLKDLPPNLEVNPSILVSDNLWYLSDIQRVQFISSLLKTNLEHHSSTFETLLKELSLLQSEKEEIEVEYKVGILKSKRLIGMTIVGASIHHALIQSVSPRIVIVEEAAEVLEPNLVAALSPGIQHLVMIGDHMQLRPLVETYKLRKKYHFDTSMMERLINNECHFEKLEKQNRMLPEFAELLKDIYPNLKNNDETIGNNRPLICIEKSMFFWSHSVSETSERSYRNEEEISRVELLVQYLIQAGCQASDITVLGAYQGQTTRLRNVIRQHKDLKEVVVNTIDMYQGDENKYIIVSLVRSNGNQKIGFLAELNRRCVAQSRAKCGLYFVGNAETFSSNSHWKRLIDQMKSSNCVGTELSIQCEKHQQHSRLGVSNRNELKEIISNLSSLCSLPCGDEMPCKIPEHACRKSCKPRHLHNVCKSIVKFTFPSCGHASERECCIPQDTLKCQVKVTATLPCKHAIIKDCWVKTFDLKCNTAVEFIYEKCGHKGTKKCYQKENEVPCRTPCISKMDCYIHNCSKLCGSPHSHSGCQELADYVFPLCGHASAQPKKCSSPITSRCQEFVIYSAPCGHELVKLCSDNSPTCMHPCQRTRNCGHPCPSFCGESCEKRLCPICEKILAEKIKDEQENACEKVLARKIKDEQENAKKRVREIDVQLGMKKCELVQIKELSKNGNCAAEYQKVEDLVMKFIKPEHNWYPTVTKIEKVSSLLLERKFEKCKCSMLSTFTDYKFHGTSADSIKSIIEDGFRMPAVPGMFGSGIYFATDSSKSAQLKYTKGSNQLLLCKVLLGNTMTVKSADQTLTLSKIREQGCDSVFAQRDSKSTRGVLNDEFIIYDPKQAYPEYIITYSINGIIDPPALPKPPNGFLITTVKFTRSFDSNEPYHNMYRFAEGHFYRMLASKGMSPRKIKEIDIVQNTFLEDNFNRKKLEFTRKGIPDKVILAFYGTDVNNIDSILKNNLQLSYAHDEGIYFSECPDVSSGYGKGLLLCELLTGTEYQGHGEYPSTYHSELVQPDDSMQNSSQMVIIRDSDQILPKYVIKLESP